MTPITTTTHQQHKHRTLLLVLLAFAIMAAMFLILYWHFHRKHTAPSPTPEQSLQALDSTSLPITKSLDERAQDLTALEKSSAKTPTKSTAQRINDLNMLH
ncbi:MAG TPA: hypothetical protein VG621_00925 [Candidatus Paceibacterota bacterium]|nr:hypothetical protein [Candidatus Paceibacterota bacterium]